MAFKIAVDRARKGKGPSIIISNVVRLLPHSSSDDQRKYRTEKALNEDKKRDPLKILEDQCLKAKFISASEFKKIRDKVMNQVDEDAEWADNQEHPNPSTALDYIYSNDEIIDEPSYNIISDKIVIVDAINHALNEDMIR